MNLRQNSRKKPLRRRLAGVAGIAAASLFLASCGGSAEEAAGDAAQETGYEYGASEEEIQALFEDVEPVTLTFQPAALSPNDPFAERAIKFAENVERLSDGKVTVDIVYGQAVASHDEAPAAIADVRVYIHNLLVVYFSDEFPKFNALVTATTQLPQSSIRGELAATAAINELWWESPEVIEELESQSMYPLLAVEPTGQQTAICKEPLVEADDWSDALIRGSSATHTAQIAGLGGTPSSLAYAEVFEGLQRGTIDCALVPPLAIPMLGLADVAPHVNYTTDTAIARGPSVHAVGAIWETLPLVAKQVLFDQGAELYANSRYTDLGAAAEAAALIREAGGSYHEISDEVQGKLAEVSDSL